MAALPGELGIEIVRHYNSLDRGDGGFGIGWRLSYDTALVTLGNTVQISEADGHRITFLRDPSTPARCASADPRNGSLRLLRSGGASRYVWTWLNGRKLSFDSAGRLLEIDDGRGGLLTLTRGLQGELLAVTDPLGRRLSIRYEKGSHRIAAIESPLGLHTYAYAPFPGDAESKALASVTMPDQRSRRLYHYEPEFQAGNAHALTGISTQDAVEDGDWQTAQRLSTYAYEHSGRAVWSMRGAGIETVAVGRSAGTGTREKPAMAEVVNARGEKTLYSFAVIGDGYRLLHVAGAGCAHCGPTGQRYEYDGAGRLIARAERGADGKPRRTEYEYDPDGRLVMVKMPSVVAGKVHSIEFIYGAKNQASGMPIARIEAGFSISGAIRRRIDYAFDGKGRLIADGTTRIRYDSRGRIAERRDRSNAATRYEYDELSRPLRISMFDGRNVRYGYDRRGRLASIDIDGRVEHYEYDGADRLTRVTRPNGERLDYRYDAANRVSSITDANGDRISFGRDREGELLWREFRGARGEILQSRDERFSVASDAEAAVEFDASGRAVRLQGASENFGSYEYDDFGRLTSYSASSAGKTRFEYGDDERPSAKILPNGVRIEFSYDSSGRRMEMTAPEGRTAILMGTNRKPSEVRYPGGRETFHYDRTGRLLMHSRELGGRSFTTRYRYDSAGFMTDKWLPGGQVLHFVYRRSPSRNAGLLESIELIDHGARRALISQLNSPSDTLNHRSFRLLGKALYEKEFDVAGRLQSIGADGLWRQSLATNLAGAAEVRGRPIATSAAVWPLHGQVRDASGAMLDDGRHRFEWDSSLRLVSVSNQGRRAASFAYDADGQRVSKTIYAADGVRTMYFIYEQGKLIGETDFRGNVSKQYVWLDEQPVALIDGDHVWSLVADQQFAPRAAFDGAQRIDPARVTNLRGSHQYLDQESGLLYNGRRYFDPTSTAYLSPDPLGLAGGADSYAFAGGDPARFVDLHGLQAQPVGAESASVADWSLEQKLGYIFEDAARQIKDHELAAALRELISPAAIATTAVIFSTWAGSQFTPYGWVADIALTGIGALFLGKSIWDVIETTYQVARGLVTARCEGDLRDAAAVLARGLSQAAATLAAAGATGAAVGGIRIARLLRTVFRRELPQVRRSSTLAAINERRFGTFNPVRGPYSGRAANQEWAALQRANGRSDAHPPWDPAKSVIDTWLNPGDKVYIIQDRSAGPGGWATPTQYQSLEQARNELSVLLEFKGADSDLVVQEYTVTTAMPVREGYSGPQVSGWPASETYVGGGQQIQFLVDLRGAVWERFLVPTQTIELSK